MENLGFGLTLMLIGMVTVFAILLIVINLSKLLILVVNKIAPETPVPVAATPAQQIDAVTQEIIRLTVAKLTDGKGRVKHVEQI